MESADIIAAVCSERGLEPSVLRTTADDENDWRWLKTPVVVEARWACVVRLRDELALSYPEIARAVGYRNHTSALHAYRSAKRLAAPEDDDGNSPQRVD